MTSHCSGSPLFGGKFHHVTKRVFFIRDIDFDFVFVRNAFMAELRTLRFSNLPEDVLRVISSFCDCATRCAVTCTNSELNLVFLGIVALSERASDQFLNEAPFRVKILRRLKFNRLICLSHTCGCRLGSECSLTLNLIF